jgi:hypothetical protein
MSNNQETTTGSEMGIFSESDQSISETEMATTQVNGSTPTADNQASNYQKNVDALFTKLDAVDDDDATEKVMRQIAYALGQYARKVQVSNPFTGEEITLNWEEIKVKGNGISSYSVILESLMASLASEKVTEAQANSVLAKLKR